MALLTEGGFRVKAVDLTGSGIQSSDADSVKTIAQCVKPLVDLLDKLGDGEKVTFFVKILRRVRESVTGGLDLLQFLIQSRLFSWDMISEALVCRM